MYGSGWSKSPVYSQWANLSRGGIPYEALPSVYKMSKIVIDDANHVTKPWGSVNSRVYDALAAGCLVITNGKVGSRCSFNNNLPVYESISDLKRLLKHFLRNSSHLEGLAKELQNHVVMNDTYDNRVKELIILLSNYGVPLIEMKKTETPNEDPTIKSVCIGLRTYEAQKNVLSVFLGNMMAQYRDSKYFGKIGMKIFVANTDRCSKQFDETLMDTVNTFNSILKSDYHSFVTLVSSHMGTNQFIRQHNNVWFGYDSSDMLLDVMKADVSSKINPS